MDASDKILALEVEAAKMAKQIRVQHESSRSFKPPPRKPQEESLDERLVSLYEVDYSLKSVKPSQPRPCSVTRRNNPQPSHMFMNWKVPTRLIVNEPSYQQQRARLLLDSKQRFYEDINGERKYIGPSHSVLKEVSKLRDMDHTSLLQSRRPHSTSTTHHVPPYGMFKQNREVDIEEEIKRTVGIKRLPTPAVPKLPAVPSSPPRHSGGNDISIQMSRNLQPRAVAAAQDWLKTAGLPETKIINKALAAVDIDRTLGRTLQPDAKKAVEKWLTTANEKDREVAIQFFGSLAGSKLMGAKDVSSQHEMHKDDDGQKMCKICDGQRLKEVMDALKGKPVASVTLKKDSKTTSHRDDHRLQLLTPYSRSHKPEFQTWHHLPVFKHNGPVSNTIALFTRPHRMVPRHFTIHPEWE